MPKKAKAGDKCGAHTKGGKAKYLFRRKSGSKVHKSHLVCGTQKQIAAWNKQKK